ncbi:MAG: hypothetical protein IT285_09440 [Bdellovibrionales bacterium]|nr:hypothetical protein [Bdellovibrionales bacterium]
MLSLRFWPAPAAVVLMAMGLNTAWGGPVELQVTGDAEVGPKSHSLNLRGGMASVVGEGSRPEMCLDVAPWRAFSFEACGNGSTVLHSDPNPTVMHVRGKLLFTTWNQRPGWLQLMATVGFAELQVGADSPGFHFTSTGPEGVETAGPEAGMSARWLVPLKDSGFEAVVEANVSLAYLPHAPELVKPQSGLQPSVELTVGIGF